MDPSHIAKVTINAGVITVSTTRDKDTDTSGKIICDLFKLHNINVNYYEIVPDIEEEIIKSLKKALESSNYIVFNGGTGITPDDCTIEAIEPLLQKKIDGFGEYFRLKSFDDVGTRAILSRAIAGIIEKKAVFCIPGSNAAVKLAMEKIILKEASHIITHAGKSLKNK